MVSCRWRRRLFLDVESSHAAIAPFREIKRPKAHLQPVSPLLFMPAGLAVGFGSKEFAYAPCGAIHPVSGGSPVPLARVRLYSVVAPKLRRRSGEVNDSAYPAAIRRAAFCRVATKATTAPADLPRLGSAQNGPTRTRPPTRTPRRSTVRRCRYLPRRRWRGVVVRDAPRAPAGRLSRRTPGDERGQPV